MSSLRAINRYPVKSMLGESLTTARISAEGIPGDRAWAVRDDERGGIRGAKRFAELMSCSARFTEEPSEAQRSTTAEIGFPNGAVLSTSADEVNNALSELVGSDTVHHFVNDNTKYNNDDDKNGV